MLRTFHQIMYPTYICWFMQKSLQWKITAPCYTPKDIYSRKAMHENDCLLGHLHVSTSLWRETLTNFFFCKDDISNQARPCLVQNFLDFDTVALSFLFDKYYSIIEQLGLKDSSRDLQVNCVISYLFYIYLMFHACAAKFDVMENLVKFWVF